ncbi:MAG: hypothetical protein JNM52_11035 [Betaproteobacteria bacterium]|nr:hypothetical protein [Betaproteobacteria bacterium]
MSIQQTIKDNLSRCRTLHANGNYQQAEVLALRCIAQSSEVADAVLYFRSITALGHVQRAQEQFDDALSSYVAALNLAKEGLDSEWLALAWLNAGLLFLDVCAWDFALAAFCKITQDDVLSKTGWAHNAYGNLAVCHLYLNNLSQSLRAIDEADSRAPANFAKVAPLEYMFRHHVRAQLTIRSNGLSAPKVSHHLNDLVGDAKGCRDLHADNRSIDLLCDLIEGSVAITVATTLADANAGIALLYRARDKARFANDLMVDVLACLVQAEFLLGRHDRMQEHLEAWVARSYEGTGWHAAQMLGLHQKARMGEVLAAQWPQLGLTPSASGRCGPQLPVGLHCALKTWIGARGEGRLHQHWAGINKIAELVCTGLSDAEVGALVGISRHSAKTMRRRLYKTQGVEARSNAYVLKRLPSVKDYYDFLINQDFDTALDQWQATPPRFRDSRVRLLICMMLYLVGRDDNAEQESSFLLTEDVTTFSLFKSWWGGGESTWHPLLNSLRKCSNEKRYPVLLTLYFACAGRKKYALAAEIGCDLQHKLSAAP